MAYSNSPLVCYIKRSPNHSGQRTRAIDRITPHCVAGQCSVETLGDIFSKTSRRASSNYGIGPDGRVGLYVDECNRSWCSSSQANDQRAVTIECASDTQEPYAMRSAVYEALVKLCADICQRNGKTRLLWLGGKEKSLAYKPADHEMVLTVHRWFANKSCPGDWLYSRLGDLADRVNAILHAIPDTAPVQEVTQAADLLPLSNAEVVAAMGPLFTDDQRRSGILASVSMAQFILESGYGKSELAQRANNLFGMKRNLSGNDWPGSAWDGESVYTKETKEQDSDGSYRTITADFRKYPTMADSIADHSAYLLGARNGKRLRYAGLKGCGSYRKAAEIIRGGGYATSLTYVDKLCAVVERWDLTRFDVKSGEEPSMGDTSFLVRVDIPDLNIRKGPGTDYPVNGVTGKGVFTIVEVQAGKGSAAGWGRLKSGAGWISLGYCTRI